MPANREGKPVSSGVVGFPFGGPGSTTLAGVVVLRTKGDVARDRLPSVLVTASVVFVQVV